MPTKTLLEIDAATVCRGDVTVFENLNLTLKEREAVAVVGPNGAGKSTLAKLLARELYPVYRDPPSVRIRGRSRFVVADYRREVGLVADDALRFLSQQTTVRAALGDAPRTAALLEAFDLGHLADRALGALSSGEKRRVMLARALVSDPAIVILDEPFSQLDLAACQRFSTLLRKHLLGRCALMLITHRLSDVPPEIDRVVGLGNGGIQFDGPKAKVLTASRLSALYGAAVHLIENDGWYVALPQPAAT
ncbi:MAG: ATP-binding cassette domain-containing protein [Pseudomonadota bacterium]